MLSYRHGFHAGNQADVLKHLILLQIMRALRRKDKAFCVLDTHAGAGCYDLQAPPAQQNREFRGGIGRLWTQSTLSPELADYVQQVRALNPDGALRWYPGSPRLARALLRPQDRLLLTERHPTEAAALQREFAGDRQAAVHPTDGYGALTAFLPPPERRGLVLLDPAYELQDEWQRLIAAIQLIRRRWATGILAVWYPLLDRTTDQRWHQALQALTIPALLCAELELYPENGPPGLRGSGMLLMNPPWQLDETLSRLLPELGRRLSVGAHTRTRLEWLTPAP